MSLPALAEGVSLLAWTNDKFFGRLNDTEWPKVGLAAVNVPIGTRRP